MASSVPTFRIAQQADGRFLVDVRGVLPNGQTFRRRVTPKVNTKKQAEAFALATWNAALAGELETRRPRATLAKVWQDFWQQHVLGSRLKPSQQQSLQSLWDNHLEPTFGAVPVDKIDYAAIQTFKAARAVDTEEKRALKPKTVNNVLIALKTMLRFAKGQGLIDDLPQIQMLKVPKTQPKIYDIPTYNKLVATALEMSPRHAAVVLLGGEVGLRAGEILALRSSDFTLPFLRVSRSVWRGFEGTTKGNAERMIPLTERTAAIVERLMDGDKPLLRSSKGTRLNQTQLGRLLDAVQERAGTEKLSLHKLRHTYGTDVTRTLGIRAAQVLLGHADVKTTERYAHVIATNDMALALEAARGTPRAIKSDET